MVAVEHRGDPALHALELLERQAVHEPIRVKPPGAALDHDMRLELARHDGLQRRTVEVGEHGPHAGDVLLPPYLAVALVDHDPDRGAVAVAGRERLQVIGRQVDHPGEVIGIRLRLGVGRGLER